MSEREPMKLDEIADALWAEDGSPGWTEDEVWRGSFTAARAKAGVAVAEFLESVGRALPPRIFGAALTEYAASIRHGWMFPPGVGSGEEYVDYLHEIRRTPPDSNPETPEHP